MSIDTGIMPLSHNPWECGKYDYKPIQHVDCGTPMVASPVGVNNDIVSDDVGCIAMGPEEWAQALRVFADSPERRRVCGAGGRLRVERPNSLEVVAPRVVDIFREVIGVAERMSSARGH